MSNIVNASSAIASVWLVGQAVEATPVQSGNLLIQAWMTGGAALVVLLIFAAKILWVDPRSAEKAASTQKERDEITIASHDRTLSEITKITDAFRESGEKHARVSERTLEVLQQERKEDREILAQVTRAIESFATSNVDLREHCAEARGM